MSSFSIWDCVLKGCFKRATFWRAKLHLKGIEDFNLEHWFDPWWPCASIVLWCGWLHICRWDHGREHGPLLYNVFSYLFHPTLDPMVTSWAFTRHEGTSPETTGLLFINCPWSPFLASCTLIGLRCQHATGMQEKGSPSSASCTT